MLIMAPQMYAKHNCGGNGVGVTRVISKKYQALKASGDNRLQESLAKYATLGQNPNLKENNNKTQSKQSKTEVADAMKRVQTGPRPSSGHSQRARDR